MGTPCLSGNWCQLLKSIVRNLPHFNKKTYEKKIQMWYMIMHWKSISQINRIVTRNMTKVVLWHNNEDNDNDEIWLIDYVFSWDQEMWSDMWWKGELWSCKKSAFNRPVKTLFGSLGPPPPLLFRSPSWKKMFFLLLPLIENVFANWNQRIASLQVFVRLSFDLCGQLLISSLYNRVRRPHHLVWQVSR